MIEKNLTGFRNLLGLGFSKTPKEFYNDHTVKLGKMGTYEESQPGMG